jgi:Lipocalin-like domain
MGRDVAGYLTYHEDGYMAVTIMQADRPKFASADPGAGSPEERAAAFDTYVSYCGTYEIHGTKVIHRIELSLFPNWVGTDQERYFEFRGDWLALRTPPMTIGRVEQTVRVTWQRVGARSPMQ